MRHYEGTYTSHGYPPEGDDFDDCNEAAATGRMGGSGGAPETENKRMIWQPGRGKKS